MRIDSSFQPYEKLHRIHLERGAWRTDFPNAGKEATQDLHLRYAAMILIPDRSLTDRPAVVLTTGHKAHRGRVNERKPAPPGTRSTA
jgi:hypothetical protein